MSSAPPEDPSEYFRRFVPERFASITGQLEGRSSSGSVVVKVGSQGSWVLRVKDGALVVVEGDATDALLTIAVSDADFGPVFLDPTRVPVREVPEESRDRLARVLAMDAESASLLQSLSGTVVLALRHGSIVHRVAASPGANLPDPDRAGCTVELDHTSYLGLTAGTEHPLTLFTQGRARLSGDPQLLMAIAGAFA